MILLLAARSQALPRPRPAHLGESSPDPRLGEHRSGGLTVREVQLVRLVALGRSNDEISQELVVSPRTVHSHVSSALRKTGMRKSHRACRAGGQRRPHGAAVVCNPRTWANLPTRAAPVQ